MCTPQSVNSLIVSETTYGHRADVTAEELELAFQSLLVASVRKASVIEQLEGMALLIYLKESSAFARYAHEDYPVRGDGFTQQGYPQFTEAGFTQQGNPQWLCPQVDVKSSKTCALHKYKLTNCFRDNLWTPGKPDC